MKIGVFDSGVGGLSVLRAIQSAAPSLQLLYMADQAHVPYGRREMHEIRAFSKEITRFLLDQRAELIVVACNTASAAALKHLRSTFPNTPIVGMEPAVKPAAENTKSKKIGILATPATFQGELYRSLVTKYGDGLTIFQSTCPGLVEQIEAGSLDGKETRKILEEALIPMLSEGIDMVVLGCTHYPFVISLIQQISGDNIQVIDPAPAVARRVLSLLDLDQQNEQAQGKPPLFFTSTDPQNFKRQIQHLLNINAQVQQVTWTGGLLKIA